MDLNKKRCGAIKRTTAETAIDINLNLDGIGKSNIKTKIGFFDHMLTLLSAHSLIDMEIFCDGDIEVDGHHSVEDCGIALGQAFKEAIGDKRGINRYGTFYVPMDEALALVSLDISGRPYLVCDMGELAPMIGDFDTELVEEFMRAFAFNAGITLHIKVMYGKNSHHKVEGVFKALGHALRQAVEYISRRPFNQTFLSRFSSITSIAFLSSAYNNPFCWKKPNSHHAYSLNVLSISQRYSFKCITVNACWYWGVLDSAARLMPFANSSPLQVPISSSSINNL